MNLIISFTFIINAMVFSSLGGMQLQLPVSWPAQASANLGNIHFDEDVLETSWRRISSSSSEDVLIKTNIFVLAIRLQDVFKTSSRRFQDVFKTSSRRFQDVFKTSSRRFEDVFKTSSKRLQDLFKASSRRLQDVLKTSSRCLQDIFKTSCKDIFKTFWRRIIRLNCLPRSRICLDHTSEKFMVSIENLQVWQALA